MNIGKGRLIDPVSWKIDFWMCKDIFGPGYRWYIETPDPISDSNITSVHLYSIDADLRFPDWHAISPDHDDPERVYSIWEGWSRKWKIESVSNGAFRIQMLAPGKKNDGWMLCVRDDGFLRLKSTYNSTAANQQWEIAQWPKDAPYNPDPKSQAQADWEKQHGWR